MTIPPKVRQKTDELLAMYATYKELSNKQALLARQLAKAKLKNEADPQLEKEYQLVGQHMQAVSDSMTFASPFIWALYKFEAYANETQPIRTMQDFRLHCSKPGYICTKRFTFVNQALNKHQLPTLADVAAYADSQLLNETFETLYKLSQDDTFMQEWRTHEYYNIEGRVAKWENFASSTT